MPALGRPGRSTSLGVRGSSARSYVLWEWHLHSAACGRGWLYDPTLAVSHRQVLGPHRPSRKHCLWPGLSGTALPCTRAAFREGTGPTSPVRVPSARCSAVPRGFGTTCRRQAGRACVAVRKGRSTFRTLKADARDFQAERVPSEAVAGNVTMDVGQWGEAAKWTRLAQPRRWPDRILKHLRGSVPAENRVVPLAPIGPKTLGTGDPAV